MKNKNFPRKTVRILCLHGILFALASITYGQESNTDRKREWQLGLGYENFRTLDENVSPLIYTSDNGNFIARFQKYKPKTRWNIGMNISMGSNQSKRHGKRAAVAYDPYPLSGDRDSVVYEINPGLSFIQAELYYAMLWKLRSEKKPLFVGALLSERFTYGALGADTWFFNQLSMMVAGQTSIYDRRKSRIDVAISIPLISYLLRQPYSLDPSLPESSYFKAYLKTGSEVATINKFQQVNITMDYVYQLKGKNAIGLSWQFMWMNNSNLPDRNLKAYANSFSIIYKF